ncbi:hypothetical protein BJ969_004079 [Saccharopolyspora gloriosae]|uniref:Uncharacterized protein n=1 Tax=Saccharopolyspora gloriosae TaxID=455344 RepID=A0A840NIV7_9PSEU|nr:hypothetical protein [Saccharopolyspora gloriosae]
MVSIELIALVRGREQVPVDLIRELGPRHALTRNTP